MHRRMTDTEYRELSGEEDPTERMTELAELRAGHTADDVADSESSEQQEKARERAEESENLRGPDHEGEITTDEFDLEEALADV